MEPKRNLNTEEIITGINSDDNVELQLDSIRKVRNILSVKNPDFEYVIEMKILPKILDLMLNTDKEEFKMECAWLLTNLASGYEKGTMELLRHKGAEKVKQLLDKSESLKVKTQCFWTFANIACENEDCRNKILSMGILQKLVAFIDNIGKQGDKESLKICIWALSNFFLTKFTLPDSIYCTKALDTFIKYYFHPDKTVHDECIYGINLIIDKSNYVDKVIESGILKNFKLEMESSDLEQKQISHFLQMIGSIAYGSDTQTQYLVDNGFIPIVSKFMNSKDIQVQKEALWIISNIAAGCVNQVIALFDANVFPKVIQELNNPNLKIRREALWIITNATMCKSYKIVVHLVKLEVLKYLTALLDDKNDEIVRNACCAISNILSCGQIHFFEVNIFAVLVEKYGALRKLELLQIHPSWSIVDKVISILEGFFCNL